MKYLPKCNSTNERMNELVQRGEARHGKALYTDHQTHGRGQHGKEWFDQPGKNLALSVFLKPKRWPVTEQYLLNKLVACAVHQALTDFADVSIKWPNDIFYRDKKLAGILVENSVLGKNIEHAVVGVGINVNADKFPEFSPGAISLAQIGGNEMDIEKVAGEVAANILNWFQVKSREEVENYYHRNLYSQGVYRIFKVGNDYELAAIKGVNTQGSLALYYPDGKSRDFSHGEVKYFFE